MPHGKESIWSGTLPAIAAIALPFLLLVWLLADTAADHMERYDRMDEVLASFRAGLAAVEPVESMRDLAAANVFVNAPEVHRRYQIARDQAQAQLAEFLARLRAFDNVSLDNSAERIDTAWRELTIDANNMSNPVVPFENVERFNDEIYGAMESLFFISDMDAGEGANARELLMLALDTLRRARQELGMVRSIAVYTSLRDGYLASTDAETLDNAWSELSDLEKNLRTELGSAKLLRTAGSAVADDELNALRTYLVATEDSLILSPQIGPDWRVEWERGEQTLADLRQTGNRLTELAHQQVHAARGEQLRLDLFTAFGVVLLFCTVTTLAVLFFRTRYTALQAQAENRAKSLFLARMSHEIRTPLNGMIGLAELLADTQPTPRQQEYIELIGNAGRSLVNLVNDILDHAKIEAGKLDLERTPVDIRAVIAESAQVFGLRAGENRTLIFCVADDDVPPLITGDPTRIRQILLNLIGNAVKFTEQGRIEVHAERAVGNDGAPRLRVEVRDTGIGLTPAQQQNLFNLFTQASPEVSRRFGGTGLGLSISRELVRLMGGSIGVYSGVGAGSVFWFELPLESTASIRPPEQPLPLPAATLLLDTEGHLARAVSALPDAIAEHVTVAVSEPDAIRMLDLHPDLRFVVINGQRRPQDAVVIADHLAAAHPALRIRLLVAVGADTSAHPAASGHPSIQDVVARSVFTAGQLAELLSPPEQKAAHVASLPTGPARAILPTGLRVLVAEDNPVNQLVTRGMLGKLGIDAEVVADGRQAVERYHAQAGQYDLVLMDLDMPVLDGNAAARAIRKLETAHHWRRCPILALSAHALPEYSAMAREAGMDGHIVKPVTLGALGDILHQHCRRTT
ncbi:MAG: ATP-binding protein [Pseudomonadota bacterium]